MKKEKAATRRKGMRLRHLHLVGQGGQCHYRRMFYRWDRGSAEFKEEQNEERAK